MAADMEPKGEALIPGISCCMFGGLAPGGTENVLRSIWKLKHERVYFAVATLFKRTEEYDRPITGMGELIAFECVKKSLGDAYGASSAETQAGGAPSMWNWYFDANFPNEHMTEDTVSIGGPRHNARTREIRERRPRLPLSFSPASKVGRDYPEFLPELPSAKDAWVMVHPGMQKGAAPYCAKLKPGHAMTDYGVISRCPNPRNPRSVVFLIEGLHTYGLAAAGHMLTRDFAGPLIAAIEASGAEFWQALIEAHVERLDATPPRDAIAGGAVKGFFPLCRADLEP